MSAQWTCRRGHVNYGPDCYRCFDISDQIADDHDSLSAQYQAIMDTVSDTADDYDGYVGSL